MYSLAWALLAAAATRAVPTQDADWQSITCDTTNVTDARVDSYIRWNAADTNESWQAVVAAWQAYNPGQDQVPLKFGAFVSNYFNGPEAWDCQDPTNVPCSTTVGCWSVSHPAGYVNVELRARHLGYSRGMTTRCCRLTGPQLHDSQLFRQATYGRSRA